MHEVGLFDQGALRVLVEHGVNPYAPVTPLQEVKANFVRWAEGLSDQAPAAQKETARPKLLVKDAVAPRLHQVVLAQRLRMDELHVLVVEILGQHDRERV